MLRAERRNKEETARVLREGERLRNISEYSKIGLKTAAKLRTLVKNLKKSAGSVEAQNNTGEIVINPKMPLRNVLLITLK